MITSTEDQYYIKGNPFVPQPLCKTENGNLIFNDYSNLTLESFMKQKNLEFNFYDKLQITQMIADGFSRLHRSGYSSFKIDFKHFAIIRAQRSNSNYFPLFLGSPVCGLNHGSVSTTESMTQDVKCFSNFLKDLFSEPSPNYNLIKEYFIYKIPRPLRKLLLVLQNEHDNYISFDDILLFLSNIYSRYPFINQDIPILDPGTIFLQSRFYLKRHVLGFRIAKYMGQPRENERDLIYLLTKRPEYWTSVEEINICYKWLADYEGNFEYKPQAAFRYAMSILTDPRKILRFDDGIQYLRMSSEMEHPRAMLEYSKLIIKGLVRDDSIENARKMLMKCLSYGIDDAFYYIGLIDINAPMPSFDYLEAAEYLQNERAYYKHALWLIDHKSGNIPKIKLLLSKAIDLGCSKAQKLFIKTYGFDEFIKYSPISLFTEKGKPAYNGFMETLVQAAFMGQDDAKIFASSDFKNGHYHFAINEGLATELYASTSFAKERLAGLERELNK